MLSEEKWIRCDKNCNYVATLTFFTDVCKFFFLPRRNVYNKVDGHYYCVYFNVIHAHLLNIERLSNTIINRL